MQSVSHTTGCNYVTLTNKHNLHFYSIYRTRTIFLVLFSSGVCDSISKAVSTYAYSSLQIPTADRFIMPFGSDAPSTRERYTCFPCRNSLRKLFSYVMPRKLYAQNCCSCTKHSKEALHKDISGRTEINVTNGIQRIKCGSICHIT